MVVLHAVAHDEPLRREERGILQDHPLRQHDPRMARRARHRIADERRLALDHVASFEPRQLVGEIRLVANERRPVQRVERLAEDAPRSACTAFDERGEGLPLICIGAVVYQRRPDAIAFVDGLGPVAVETEVQAAQLCIPERAVLDLPGPAALAVPPRWQGVHVARTAPVAVARDEHAALHRPLRRDRYRHL